MQKHSLRETLQVLTARSKAIVRTLDERLAEVDRLVNESPGDVASRPGVRTAESLEQLRASRRAIAIDLHAIEREQLEEEHEARRWVQRAQLAREEGREDLARQAEVREREHRVLAATHAEEAKLFRATLGDLDRALGATSSADVAAQTPDASRDQ